MWRRPERWRARLGLGPAMTEGAGTEPAGEQPGAEAAEQELTEAKAELAAARKWPGRANASWPRPLRLEAAQAAVQSSRPLWARLKSPGPP